MPTIRVNKTKDFTVMSNYHLRDKSMSLKAKGLLSLMLSLPDSWDFSISGLTSICKEEETSIKSTLKELKNLGYLHVSKERSKEGKYNYVYTIYENPSIENPEVENPEVENPGVENIPLNKYTNILNTKELNTNNKILNNNIKKERSKKQTVECFESIAEEMLNGYSDGVLDITKQWLQYKSERKESYTPTGLKSLINRIIKNINQYGSEKVIDVIDQSISSGYMGITWDKLNKSTEKSLNKQDNGSIMELKLLGHRQDYSPEEIRQKEYFIEEWEREMLDE